MNALQRILCPVDFSDVSRHAVEHAVAIATRYDSTLTFLHVAPPPIIVDTPGAPLHPMLSPAPADVESLLASLKRFVDRDRAPGVPMKFEIGDGDAASQILDRAREIPSDLIVIGTHGRSGFERLVLGSVTEKVIHKAPCPVLTVPPANADVEPAAAGSFTRILCAVDFSDASLLALEYALSLAQKTNAQVTLVHVVEVSPAPMSEVRGDEEARALGVYVAAAAHARAEQLQQLVPVNVTHQYRVETVLAIGSAHREILRVASELFADVIVLGAHGFSVSQLLFGSAAHQIVRQARCPVLTIR